MADGTDPTEEAVEAPAQGWHLDPFGVHEQRWISQGTPTALVRDGRVEAQDPPPDREPERPFVKVVADPRSLSGRDMARADGDKDAVTPDLGDYGMTAMGANVVFDTGLVGAPTAPGALKGGRFGGRRRAPDDYVWRPQKWAIRLALGVALVLATTGLVVQLGAPSHEVRGVVLDTTSAVSPSGASEPGTADIAYSPDGRRVYHLYVPAQSSFTNGITGVTVIYDPTDPARAHVSSTGIADLTYNGGFLYAAAFLMALLGGWWAWRRRRLGPA